MKINKMFMSVQNFFKNIHNWTMKWAHSEHSLIALFILAISESVFFPLPVDTLMIPMCIANNRKSFYIAFIALLGSVLGAYLGYLIGYAFYGTIGKFIFDLFHLDSFLDSVLSMYNKNAFGAILVSGFTPIPFKVFTIVAGISRINLLTLTLASILGRGGRFFLFAGLIRVFGDEVKDYFGRYFDFFSALLLLVVILCAILIYYI